MCDCLLFEEPSAVSSSSHSNIWIRFWQSAYNIDESALSIYFVSTVSCFDVSMSPNGRRQVHKVPATTFQNPMEGFPRSLTAVFFWGGGLCAYVNLGGMSEAIDAITMRSFIGSQPAHCQVSPRHPKMADNQHNIQSIFYDFILINAAFNFNRVRVRCHCLQK